MTSEVDQMLKHVLGIDPPGETTCEKSIKTYMVTFVHQLSEEYILKNYKNIVDIRDCTFETFHLREYRPKDGKGKGKNKRGMNTASTCCRQCEHRYAKSRKNTTTGKSAKKNAPIDAPGILPTYNGFASTPAFHGFQMGYSNWAYDPNDPVSNLNSAVGEEPNDCTLPAQQMPTQNYGLSHHEKFDFPQGFLKMLNGVAEDGFSGGKNTSQSQDQMGTEFSSSFSYEMDGGGLGKSPHIKKEDNSTNFGPLLPYSNFDIPNYDSAADFHQRRNILGTITSFYRPTYVPGSQTIDDGVSRDTFRTDSTGSLYQTQLNSNEGTGFTNDYISSIVPEVVREVFKTETDSDPSLSSSVRDAMFSLLEHRDSPLEATMLPLNKEAIDIKPLGYSSSIPTMMPACDCEMVIELGKDGRKIECPVCGNNNRGIKSKPSNKLKKPKGNQSGTLGEVKPARGQTNIGTSPGVTSESKKKYKPKTTGKMKKNMKQERNETIEGHRSASKSKTKVNSKVSEGEESKMAVDGRTSASAIKTKSKTSSAKKTQSTEQSTSRFKNTKDDQSIYKKSGKNKQMMDSVNDISTPEVVPKKRKTNAAGV